MDGVEICRPSGGARRLGAGGWVPAFGSQRLGAGVWVPSFGCRRLGAGVWVPAFGCRNVWVPNVKNQNFFLIFNLLKIINSHFIITQKLITQKNQKF